MSMRYRHHHHTLRMPRNPWLILLGLALVTGAAGVLLAIVVALLAMAATMVFLVGGAWLTWQGVRALRAPRRGRAAGRRLRREARGLLEMAGTIDPMERYLLAVREFERISAGALAIEPESAGRHRTARRAWDLAEQAQNLHDEVLEIERRLVADRTANGARTHIWELSLAVREVHDYLSRVLTVRRALTLYDLRALVGHRAALIARRTALVDRLDDVQVTRTLAANHQADRDHAS